MELQSQREAFPQIIMGQPQIRFVDYTVLTENKGREADMLFLLRCLLVSVCSTQSH